MGGMLQEHDSFKQIVDKRIVPLISLSSLCISKMVNDLHNIRINVITSKHSKTQTYL